MSKQGGLFDPPPHMHHIVYCVVCSKSFCKECQEKCPDGHPQSFPDPLYHLNAPTEKAGAEQAKPSADSIRGRVAEMLDKTPMTDQELAAAWEQRFGPMNNTFVGNTLRRRRLELKAAGIVVDTGERHLSASGVENIVWGIKKNELLD